MKKTFPVLVIASSILLFGPSPAGAYQPPPKPQQADPQQFSPPQLFREGERAPQQNEAASRCPAESFRIDQAEFERGIRAAGSVGAYSFYFEAGSYCLTSDIILDDQLFRELGIPATDTYALFRVATDNVTFDLNQFRILIRGRPKNSIAILNERHNNLTVRNGTISGSGIAIRLGQPGGRVISGQTFRNLTIDFKGTQIEANEVGGVIIRGNTFLNYSFTGAIFIRNRSGGGARGFRVTDNTFRTVPPRPWQDLYALKAEGVNDMEIVHNRVEGCSDGGWGFLVTHANEVQITANSYCGRGIFVILENSSNVSILRNQAMPYFRDQVIHLTTTQNVEISENTLGFESAVPADDSKILLSNGGLLNITVRDNTFTDAKTGIYIPSLTNNANHRYINNRFCNVFRPYAVGPSPYPQPVTESNPPAGVTISGTTISSNSCR